MRNKHFIPVMLFVLAFAYYSILSAKVWTWTFVSFDSGDWLAASSMWFVPQPYGSPLYITLGHFLNLFPGDLVVKMTLILSCIPAAVTVAVVYLIVKRLYYSDKLALTSSLVLLSCSIFLSQATVIEEYAISAMFVSIAFYYYIQRRRALVMLFLALGTSVHIIVAPIAILWLAVNFRNIYPWLKNYVIIYIPVTVLAYSLILYLMSTDAPNYIAGNLSFQSINSYLGSTGTIGRIALVEAPQRLWEASRLILVAFGVSLIPMVYAMIKIRSNLSRVMIVTMVFCLWLYITNTDMTTWTFINFAIPIAAVAVAMGLAKLPRYATILTIICSLSLLFTHVFMLNAHQITASNSEAIPYYQSVKEIPDNSAVVLPKGGAYGLGLIYAISQGQELTPVFMQKSEGWDNPGYLDYIAWVQSEGIGGTNWEEQVYYCLGNGIPVYVGYVVQPPEWKEKIDSLFTLEPYNEYFKVVVWKQSQSLE